jgi:hypothetical protein
MKSPSRGLGAWAGAFHLRKGTQQDTHVTHPPDFNLTRTGLSQFRLPSVLAVIVRDYAAFLSAAPVLISIVLVVFMALAGFLIVRCSTPLSK